MESTELRSLLIDINRLSALHAQIRTLSPEGTIPAYNELNQIVHIGRAQFDQLLSDTFNRLLSLPINIRPTANESLACNQIIPDISDDYGSSILIFKLPIRQFINDAILNNEVFDWSPEIKHGIKHLIIDHGYSTKYILFLLFHIYNMKYELFFRSTHNRGLNAWDPKFKIKYLGATTDLAKLIAAVTIRTIDPNNFTTGTYQKVIDYMIDVNLTKANNAILNNPQEFNPYREKIIQDCNIWVTHQKLAEHPSDPFLNYKPPYLEFARGLSSAINLHAQMLELRNNLRLHTDNYLETGWKNIRALKKGPLQE